MLEMLLAPLPSEEGDPLFVWDAAVKSGLVPCGEFLVSPSYLLAGSSKAVGPSARSFCLAVTLQE